MHDLGATGALSKFSSKIFNVDFDDDKLNEKRV